jgi:predicted nucleic acid-binding protein
MSAEPAGQVGAVNRDDCGYLRPDRQPDRTETIGPGPACHDRTRRADTPSSLVLYEWLRGPRVPAEIAAQEALFPSDDAIPFGPREAALSAQIYGRLRRARGREIDIAIAAVAILRDAGLWTLNTADFTGIPNLRLIP